MLGDLVLDHTNNYNKVTNFMNQGEKEIWKIKAMGLDELKTTSNHRFLVREKNIINNNRIFSEPKWIQCKDLNKNHYLGVAINNNEKLPSWEGIKCKRNNGKYYTINHLNDHFNNPKFWYLCGRFLGDGWVKNRKDRGDELSSVLICCGKHEIDDFENKIRGLFHYTKIEDKTVYKLQFSNKELAFFLNQFGRGAKNKFVPGFIIDLPKDKLKSFLDGYFDADGTDIRNGKRAVSISRKLIYGISQCVSKVYNKPYSIYKTERPNTCKIENRTVNQNNTYQMSYFYNSRKAFYENGYIWYPIRDIENTHKYEIVYDITVENSHSFTANGCIAHNCQSYSIQGKRLGFDDPTRGNLFFESVRIAKHKQPKYMIAENVKGLLSHDKGKTFEVVIKTLNDIGYNTYWKVMKSTDFDVPQARERVFIICIRKDIDKTFEFPVGKQTNKTIKDILEDLPRKEMKSSLKPYNNPKYFTKEYKDSVFNIKKLFDGVGEGYFTSSFTSNRIYSIYGVSPTLTTKNDAVYSEINGHLTQRERFKLQGFNPDYVDLLLNNGITKGCLDKVSGNSITVNVVKAIFKELLDK